MRRSHTAATKHADEALLIRVALLVIESSRFIVLVPLVVSVFLMAAYGYSICYDVASLGVKMFKHESSEAETVIGVLNIVDGILLLSIVSLIVVGSYQIYVAHEQDDDGLPSALRGMTSGKLKEKVSSSLVITSAVFLLKIVIELSDGEPGYHLKLRDFAIIGPIHLLFIIGYAVIAHTNRNDPHKAQPLQGTAAVPVHVSEPPAH